MQNKWLFIFGVYWAIGYIIISTDYCLCYGVPFPPKFKEIGPVMITGIALLWPLFVVYRLIQWIVDKIMEGRKC